jgi:uncharacterized protein YkwD
MRVLALGLTLCLATPALADGTGLGGLVNGFRADSGRAPLVESPVATRAAEAHAADMASGGFFSHEGSDGSSVGDRLARAGCRWTAVAENIAKGQRSATDVVAGWAGSPGHRRNMLGRYGVYGAARAGDVWVLVLGAGC